MPPNYSSNLMVRNYLDQNILHTVDHHSLEYGPSNKNLFQTMGVFHTMGGKKIIFFTLISVVVGTLISVVVATLFLGVPT